jgi:hypothetical protein
MLCEGREEEYVDLLRVRGMPVEAVHRIDASGGVLSYKDDEGVDELVARFRKFVQTDRAFHDKVTAFRVRWGVMVGDEGFSIVCSSLLETSGEFYFSDQRT